MPSKISRVPTEHKMIWLRWDCLYQCCMIPDWVEKISLQHNIFPIRNVSKVNSAETSHFLISFGWLQPSHNQSPRLQQQENSFLVTVKSEICFVEDFCWDLQQKLGTRMCKSPDLNYHKIYVKTRICLNNLKTTVNKTFSDKRERKKVEDMSLLSLKSIFLEIVETLIMLSRCQVLWLDPATALVFTPGASSDWDVDSWGAFSEVPISWHFLLF